MIITPGCGFTDVPGLFQVVFVLVMFGPLLGFTHYFYVPERYIKIMGKPKMATNEDFV